MSRGKSILGGSAAKSGIPKSERPKLNIVEIHPTIGDSSLLTMKVVIIWGKTDRKSISPSSDCRIEKSSQATETSAPRGSFEHEWSNPACVISMNPRRFFFCGAFYAVIELIFQTPERQRLYPPALPDMEIGVFVPT